MAWTDNLVGHWKLDETSGTRADAHSGGYDLTDNNTVGYASDGPLGNCARFVAANSERLSIADTAALDCVDPTPLTWCAWVRLNDKTSNRTIIGKHVVSNKGPKLYWRSSTDRWTIRINATELSANNYGSPPTGTWHFVLASYDPDANVSRIRVNNGTANSTTVTTSIADNAAVLAIGANGTSGTVEYMDGDIQSVSYWQRILTSQEETDLYNGGAGLAYPFSSGSSYTASFADALTVGETLARAAGFGRSHADSASIADTLGRLAGFARAQADAASLGETRAAALAAVRSAADALTMGDAQAAALVLVRSISDALALADARTAALVLVRTFADALAIADQSARVAGFSRAQAEALTIGDSAARIAAYVRAASDAASLADAVARAANFVRANAEALNLADSRSAAIVALLAVLCDLATGRFDLASSLAAPLNTSELSAPSTTSELTTTEL